MTTLVTARDMAQMEKTRRNVKKETYKAILDQFSRKIRSSYELGHREAVLTVPPFVVGFPKYELAPALKYLVRQVQLLGYQVHLVGPLSFRVTWVQPQKAKDNFETVEGPVDLLPGLVNLQKAAQKIRIHKRGHAN